MPEENLNEAANTVETDSVGKSQEDVGVDLNTQQNSESLNTTIVLMDTTISSNSPSMMIEQKISKNTIPTIEATISQEVENSNEPLNDGC